MPSGPPGHGFQLLFQLHLSPALPHAQQEPELPLRKSILFHLHRFHVNSHPCFKHSTLCPLFIIVHLCSHCPWPTSASSSWDPFLQHWRASLISPVLLWKLEHNCITALNRGSIHLCLFFCADPHCVLTSKKYFALTHHFAVTLYIIKWITKHGSTNKLISPLFEQRQHRAGPKELAAVKYFRCLICSGLVISIGIECPTVCKAVGTAWGGERWAVSYRVRVGIANRVGKTGLHDTGLGFFQPYHREQQCQDVQSTMDPKFMTIFE